MFIKHLSLQNFRSYQKKEFNFDRGTSLIVGLNTSGKTNLLEAIYLLATGKSFRAGLESEMIAYDEDLSRVTGNVMGETETKLTIILTRGQLNGERVSKKKFLVNDISRRMSDFVGNLKAVYFGPTDLDLVGGSPSQRRHYLDSVLSQADSEYARMSLSYEKALRQRNKLLERIKEETANRSQLIYWDHLLVKNGSFMTERREEFIHFINNLPQEKGDFELLYNKSLISPSRLAQYAEEEIAACVTLVGPHRDDFVFIKGKKEGVNLSAFGSRGEQRLGVFWLKLGELEYIAQKAGLRPILLLDDIFSELDFPHREEVLKLVPKQQTMITTTDSKLINRQSLKKLNIVELT